ncbi:MAG: C40 family peptidase [Clostridia bacterium]|nr:C40 family peptidase [Clostridia bacterium]
MKKAITLFLAIAVAAAVFILMPVLSFATEETPSAEIVGYNLIVSDNVYISYGVRFENSDGEACGLLVWSAYQDDYTYANADYRLSSVGKNGDMQVFEFRNITVKQMTDDFYARAYVLKDGAYYYSQVKKYSILQYAYNKLGYTGVRTENEDLVNYLNSMLKYGGRTQTYENYKTDRLASDRYYRINTPGGKLEDGFDHGLYKEGDVVTLTSDGPASSYKWYDCRDSAFSRTGDTVYTVGAKNETLTAKKTVNLLVFGDSMVCGYNVTDLFVSFASADGIAVNKSYSITFNNLDPARTTASYNIYELVNSTSMTSSGTVTGIKSSKLQSVLDQDENVIDYFIVTVSREKSIANSTYRNLNKRAFLYVEQALLAKNPDLKTVLIASPGFQDGSPAFTNFSLTSAVPSKTRAAHNAAIKTRCEDILASAQSDCSIAYVGDAFDLHYAATPCIDLYTETLRHNSPAGAYLTACVLYSSVFGKTTSRIDENGFLSAEDAALLRAEADTSVFGAAAAPAEFISPNMPRFGYSYPDARFSGETYPDNFDVLLSSALAYRLRGRYAQYDQMTTERVKSNFARRRVSPPANRPEAATPQNKLYIDCSSFVYSAILDAFDFSLGANRSKTLTFNDLANENLLIPYEWNGNADGALSPSAAISLLLSTIKPGDVLSYSNADNSEGHTMLYIGNGQFIHCTGASSFGGGGADYDFTGRYDKQEIPSPVIFDNIDVLIKTYESRYLFDPASDITVRLLRPVYANLTPSARAVSRMNDLSGVLVYKESTAPRGVTVNPGGDVTFTVVMRNYSDAPKTVSITEELPAGVSYKTGVGTFERTLAPGETKSVSYTVTVADDVPLGTVLSVQSSAFSVPLNVTEIRVGKTLTASQQNGVTAALEGLSAADGFELASLYYSAEHSYELPFSSVSDLFTKVFDSDVYNSKPYVQIKTGSTDTLKMLVTDVYGGQSLYKATDPSRPGYISDFNFIPGDILVTYDDETGANASVYVVTGDNNFATVNGGVYTVTASSSDREMLLETLMGRFAFILVRPSLVMTPVKNIVVFGDGFLTANCMGDIVAKFAEADGEKFNVVCARTTDNIEPDPSTRLSTWHQYEWSGTTMTGESSSGASQRFFNAIDGGSGKIDYLWIETSRDWGTSTSTTEKTKMEKAFKALYERAEAANPGITISLINPAGLQDGNERPYNDSYNPTGTRKGHNDRINTFATRLSNAVGGCDRIFIGDAFEYFIDNYGTDEIDLYDPLKAFPSIAGSYYAACVLYSSVTERATTGMPFCGYLDEITAAALQAVSDEFLASRSVTLKPHGASSSFLPMTLEEADPRNRPADPDPAFADDVNQYPDNYDLLLSSAFAYYARGRFTQYDNSAMGRAGAGTTAYRRTTNPDKSSPEDASSQSILYTDCSAYIYAVMCDAFTDFNFGGNNRCTTIFQYYYENATYGLGGTNLWPKNHTPKDPPEDPSDPEYMTPGEMKPPAPKNLVPYVWRQRSDNPDLDPDVMAADSAAIKAILRPGDVIVFANESRDLSVGHIMLYMGNGIMLHSTGLHAFGGGENYLYQVGTEDYEMNGAIRYDNVTDTTDVDGWLCPFLYKNWVCMVIRPDYGSYTPSAKATARLNDLNNTLAYKETTAPEGVTVSANCDVTFTVVIYNYGLTGKTYTVTDTIPSSFNYVSASGFSRSGSSLSATVTLAPQETRRLSYTLSVKSTVAERTAIDCKNTYVNGVLLNNTRVWVVPTLSASDQTAIKNLLAARGPSASTDIGLVQSIYSGLTFSNKEDAFDRVFETHTDGTRLANVKNGYYVTLNTYNSSATRLALAWDLFGGVGYMTRSPDSFDRIKHISTENLVVGDLLFTIDNDNDKIEGKDISVFVYAGDGRLATVVNGEYVLYSVSRSQAITESLLAKYAYFVIRPSMQGGSPKA